MEILFKNIRIVDHSQDKVGSVLIKDNKIEKIFKRGEKLPEDLKVFEGDGFTLMPGFIDTHSHLRDPGLTYKEDIESGLRAAAKGGFTTVCGMANTLPVISTRELVKKNLAKAQALSGTDLIQIASVTKDFGDELIDFENILDLTSVFSNDGKNIDNKEIMREVLEKSKELGFIIATHNQPETKTIVRDVELLKETGGNLHICHISKKESLDAVRAGKEDGLNITAEVTPHHLFKSGLDFKVHPPFRTEEDREAMIKGIKDGIIISIGTDHAPHSAEDKRAGSPGLIGYESAFGITNKVFSENNLSLSDLSRLNSFGPARLLGIEGGEIKEGNEANLVLVKPDEKWKFREDSVISKSKNSPFFGEELLGKVYLTINHGKIIYQSGELNERF